MNSIITGGYSSIEQAAGKLSNKRIHRRRQAVPVSLFRIF